MAENKPDSSGSGCLAVLFTFMGFGLIAAYLFSQVQNFSSGFGFQVTGAIFPALVLIGVGRAFAKRARSSTSSEPVRIPMKPTSGKGPVRPTISVPKKAPPSDVPTQVPTPPMVVIPELPEVEEVYEPGVLPAVGDLDLSDFEPGRPLSSEERIRLAKEKYKKP
jgi:hypothetical protein